MFRHTEERWYKGYEIIMTMLGGKSSKKSPTKKNKLKDDLLCQNKEDYASLTPQEKDELTNKMQNKYKESIAELFGGNPQMMGFS
jgi:hypothetical protein